MAQINEEYDLRLEEETFEAILEAHDISKDEAKQCVQILYKKCEHQRHLHEAAAPASIRDAA